MKYDDIQKKLAPLSRVNMNPNDKARILESVRSHNRRPLQHTKHKQRSAIKATTTWLTATAALIIAAIGIAVFLQKSTASYQPLLGGYNKTVQISQLPNPVQRTAQILIHMTADTLMTNPTHMTVTAERKNLLQQPVFRFVVKYPAANGKVSQTSRTAFAVTSDGKKILYLRSYDSNNKLTVSKADLAVSLKHFTFTGTSSHWTATFQFQSTTIESGKPEIPYQSQEKGHYTLRYTGPHPASISNISFKITRPGGSFSTNNTPLPKSGVLSGSTGEGGGSGGPPTFKGGKVTFSVKWNGKHETIRLHQHS